MTPGQNPKPKVLVLIDGTHDPVVVEEFLQQPVFALEQPLSVPAPSDCGPAFDTDLNLRCVPRDLKTFARLRDTLQDPTIEGLLLLTGLEPAQIIAAADVVGFADTIRPGLPVFQARVTSYEPAAFAHAMSQGRRYPLTSRSERELGLAQLSVERILKEQAPPGWTLNAADVALLAHVAAGAAQAPLTLSFDHPWTLRDLLLFDVGSTPERYQTALLLYGQGRLTYPATQGTSYTQNQIEALIARAAGSGWDSTEIRLPTPVSKGYEALWSSEAMNTPGPHADLADILLYAVDQAALSALGLRSPRECQAASGINAQLIDIQARYRLGSPADWVPRLSRLVSYDELVGPDGTLTAAGRFTLAAAPAFLQTPGAFEALSRHLEDGAQAGLPAPAIVASVLETFPAIRPPKQSAQEPPEHTRLWQVAAGFESGL